MICGWDVDGVGMDWARLAAIGLELTLAGKHELLQSMNYLN
jgi:hypothetical protein